MAEVEVQLQPTVLFQIADHRCRRFQDDDSNERRAVGCIIGVREGNRLIVNNSFPVPFDENAQAYYLDEEYVLQMAYMYQKVYADEHLVGYYTTAPQFRPFDTELAAKMLSIVGTSPTLLLNVDCLDRGTFQEPFYKVYEVRARDGQTVVEPRAAAMHWSLVERVVLSAPQPRREIADIAQALGVMRAQLEKIRAYLAREDAEPEVLDRIQEILNTGVDESVAALLRKSNDNAVRVVLGELVKVYVQLKKNQLGGRVE